MAKSSKSRSKTSKTDAPVPAAASATDAVIVDVTDPETTQESDAIKTGGESGIETPTGEPQDDIDPRVDEGPRDNGEKKIEIVEDNVKTKPSDRDLTVVDPQPAPTRRSSGFLPLLVGGVVAGAIGYGVATFFPLGGDARSDDISAQLAAQSEQISALENTVANLPAPDFSSVEERVAALADETTTRLDGVQSDLSTQLSTVERRLSELEKQPNADGTLSETALATYQQELDDLRAEITAQQESVMNTAAQAESDLAAARAEAETLEQQALAAAEAAAARAALNRVATAVETGAPYSDVLTDLAATDIPAALTDAADSGVTTTAQLAADFPAAARAALATARAEGVSDDAAGLGGFLRSQFDVRSTSPQEGPGPDAVLSRAQAAVNEGRIADALTEIEALPDVARAEMSDWTARATQRVDVLDAIATLSETYN